MNFENRSKNHNVTIASNVAEPEQKITAFIFQFINEKSVLFCLQRMRINLQPKTIFPNRTTIFKEVNKRLVTVGKSTIDIMTTRQDVCFDIIECLADSENGKRIAQIVVVN